MVLGCYINLVTSERSGVLSWTDRFFMGICCIRKVIKQLEI